MAPIDRNSLRNSQETRVQTASETHTEYLTHWKRLANHLPKPSGNVVVVTRRSFSAAALIPLLMTARCHRMLVSTFNISVDAIGMLSGLLSDGSVTLLDLIVNQSIWSKRTTVIEAETLDRLPRLFPGRVRVGGPNVHAKVIAMAMSTGDNWIVEGSGNMADNANIELYSIWNDAERFRFHADWITDAM